MKMTMSNHAREDRADRLTYIAMTVGFGEVVVEKINGDCRECLTNTGVLIIKPLNKELMITAYICDMDKAFAIYKGAGNVGRMPTYLHQRICRNAVHLKIQNTVRY
jgi:hypothetical protein